MGKYGSLKFCQQCYSDVVWKIHGEIGHIGGRCTYLLVWKYKVKWLPVIDSNDQTINQFLMIFFNGW